MAAGKQRNIIGRLLLFNGLICLAFILVVGGVFFSFRRVDDVLTRVFARQTAEIVENAQVGRDLARVLSELNLVVSTFHGNEALLETAGPKLVKEIDALFQRGLDERLRRELDAFRAKVEAALDQCAAVNARRREIEASEKRLMETLAALDQTLAERMIEKMTQGEDASSIEQLSAMIAGFRESVMGLGLAFARLGLGYFESPMAPAADHPLIGPADDLTLRFQTLLAADPGVAEAGQRLLAETDAYRSHVTAFHQAAGTLRTLLTEVDLQKEALLGAMARIDARITEKTEGAAATLSGQIWGVALVNLVIFLLTLPLIVAAWFTARSIRGPIRAIVSHVDRLAKGDIPEKITDPYKGEFREVRDNLNDLIDATAETARIAEGIAAGDLSVAVVERSENDRLMKALGEMVERLNQVQAEARDLIGEIRRGRLSTRGDEGRFAGGWRDLMESINALIEAMAAPIGVAAETIDRIAKGEIPEKITRRFEGDFDRIRENLNQCIEAVEGLVRETVRLTESAVAGNLRTRGDAERFGGDYRRIITGVNATLDAVITPLTTAARSMERIAVGDHPERITEGFPGDFGAVKESLHSLIENRRAVVRVAERVADGDLSVEVPVLSDRDALGRALIRMVETIRAIAAQINVLTDTARAGKLHERGEEADFKGEYARIIRGFNATLDAIVTPLRTTAAHVDRIARGEVPERIEDDFPGEFDAIRNNLNTLIDNLSRFARDVQRSAEQVATGSEQLRSGANRVSQGTFHQAANVEEISSSMEEMSSTVEQNAGNARQTARISQEAAENAREGGRSVTETVEAMKRISDRIRIIEEIARQTNMLALNAAIEAARAGQHGRGFAVVADEIRKLAEKSGKAAKEINALSVGSLEIGEKTSRLLSEMVEGIGKTAELVQEISASSQEQAQGVHQVNRAIQDLDHGIQENATQAEEMAAASQEFSDQAERLREAAGFFRLPAPSGTAPSPAGGAETASPEKPTRSPEGAEAEGAPEAPASPEQERGRSRRLDLDAGEEQGLGEY